MSADAEPMAAGTSMWIVAKPDGYADGRYELPMFATYFDEAEARTVARKARAVLVSLPVAEDYRDASAATDRNEHR